MSLLYHQESLLRNRKKLKIAVFVILPLDKLGVTHYIVTVSLSNRQGDISDFLRVHHYWVPLIIPNPSLPRRRESSNFDWFWIPAFAGMTFLEVPCWALIIVYPVRNTLLDLQ